MKNAFAVIGLVLLCTTGCDTLGFGSSELKAQNVEQLCPEDRCGQDGKKSLICHVPPGNPSNAHDICIADVAVDDHFEEHEGDSCGACPVVEEPTCETDPSLCPPEPTCETDPSLCPPEPTCETDPSLCPPEPTCETDPSLCETFCPEDCAGVSFSGSTVCEVELGTVCRDTSVPLADGEYCGECEAVTPQ